jgi:hypothetical protein
MYRFFDSVLNKVTGKRPSAESNGHQALSENMQSYLVQQLKMKPTDMSSLRYVTRPASRGQASSRYVRIFDTTQVNAQGITVRKYQDLDRYQELVLFYGRLSKGKVSYLKRHFVSATSR